MKFILIVQSFSPIRKLGLQKPGEKLPGLFFLKYSFNYRKWDKAKFWTLQMQ